MYTKGNAAYDVKIQSRCLSSLLSDTQIDRYLLGTTTLKGENEIHIIRYKSEKNEVLRDSVYHFNGELWQIDPHPIQSPFILCSSTLPNDTKRKIGLYKLEGLNQTETNEEKKTIQMVANVPIENKKHTRTSWHTNGKSFLALHDTDTRIYACDGNSIQETTILPLNLSPNQVGHALAWDPHHTDNVAIAVNEKVLLWDSRTKTQTSNLTESHPSYHILDMDYNPNKPYQLLTSGKSCHLKFWDLRSLKEPIALISEHSHWIWNAKYNRFHDQLVISAGSDTLVNLWRISSISSSPLLLEEKDQITSSKEINDLKIFTNEEHEESVYALAWSAIDPWVFASLSYDGHFLLHHIPSSEKYKILL